jgi:hypothetical protein
MQTYKIVFANGGWAIRENEGQPQGNYASREAALEVVYAAASNDIKKGSGLSITVDPPAPGQSAIGSNPT